MYAITEGHEATKLTRSLFHHVMEIVANEILAKPLIR